MSIIDELLLLLAQSVYAKARAMERSELNARQKAWLRKSITHDIRTCGALIYPDVRAPEVSKAAHEEARRIGVLLHTQTWSHQGKFDRGRKMFHWEHVNPVSAIQEQCVKASSDDAVFTILKTSLRVAWILKREDEELTRLGYRSKRMHPDEAYRHARIELLTDLENRPEGQATRGKAKRGRSRGSS